MRGHGTCRVVVSTPRRRLPFRFCHAADPAVQFSGAGARPPLATPRSPTPKPTQRSFLRVGRATPSPLDPISRICITGPRQLSASRASPRARRSFVLLAPSATSRGPRARRSVVFLHCTPTSRAPPHARLGGARTAAPAAKCVPRDEDELRHVTGGGEGSAQLGWVTVRVLVHQPSPGACP
eukprot:scaffold1850_cov96-Isochrysis_galbana.AAC.2